jgi:DNA-directed RNA polymerase subunit beta'
LAKERPDEYVGVLQRLNDIGRQAATEYGRSASLSLDELIPPKALQERRDKLRAQVRVILNDTKLGTEDKRKAMVDAIESATGTLDDELTDMLDADNRAFGQQLKSGSRGKAAQARQILVGGLVSSDSRGRPIMYPGLEGFGEGLTPTGYWATTHGGRRGYVNLQMATADAGYFGKLITNVAHRCVVTENDCGAVETGLAVDGDDKDNVGAVLTRPAAGLPRGTVISDEHLPLLSGHKVVVRSPITCRAKGGVCAKCAGVREGGSFPEIGDQVGINAVRSFIEPLTQGAISSKHIGVEVAAAQGMSPFERVVQFMQVPEEFPGGAVLSPQDGLVSSIKKAPQGGWMVTVGRESRHVPGDVKLLVKQGDRVEAGDALSDGLPNPRELVEYKGVGEGRRYFMDKMRDLLKEGNAGTNRRNLELLARSFVSKVEVVSPDGLDGYLPGDVVSYDDLQADWEPRQGSQLKPLTTAARLYLEKPYLHYSVGTRVTPSVIKGLREHGVQQVLAHPEPPPFSPKLLRTSGFLQADKDWMTRMAGEDLTRTMKATAARGAVTEKDSTSYYPQIAFMGQNPNEGIDR